MTRREFLRGGTLAALSAAVGCRTCGDGETFAGGLRIGVQMWSVHELWKKDPVAAFRRLKQMGYDGVQSFGFYAMDWNELEKMLDGEGLQIVDMPFYMKNVRPGEFEKFVEFCQRFRIGFAYEPSSKPKTAGEWTRHAAELAAPDQQELRKTILNHQNRMLAVMQKQLKLSRQQLSALSSKRVLQSPLGYLQDRRMLLDYSSTRMIAASRQTLDAKKQQLVRLSAKLDAMSPLRVLGRGYGVVMKQDGTVLHSALDTAAGERISVRLQKGSLLAEVLQTEDEA